ncbi:MAG: ATP-dependent nuclease [Planctomycetota bacterium]
MTNQLQQSAKNPFDEYQFQRIVSDRDISPENSEPSLDVHANGSGVTNVIQQYINQQSLPSELIEDTLLQELNVIFSPDANYTRILVQRRESGQWEINLEEPEKGRVPMSQTGSGLKTVLLVLANLLLVPRIVNKPLSQFLFGFEELENNLHPAIQRRLFRYLREKAMKEGCHLFLTTHSNVVIDLFSTDEHAQLLHVTHDGKCASVSVVETTGHGHSVLDDLDVRASDLLQTNAIVWVEGPSDRIYVNRWIELWSDGELVEGVHYQCLPFGGSLNAHLSFELPEWVDEMIPALNVNRHAIVLMDSDRRGEKDELKQHTQRMIAEVQRVGGYAWVTAGREVENYVPGLALRRLFENDSLRGPGTFADVLDYAARHDSKKNRPRKVIFAQQAILHITRESIDATLDLAERLSDVCRLIREWNRLGV